MALRASCSSCASTTEQTHQSCGELGWAPPARQLAGSSRAAAPSDGGSRSALSAASAQDVSMASMFQGMCCFRLASMPSHWQQLEVDLLGGSHLSNRVLKPSMHHVWFIIGHLARDLLLPTLENETIAVQSAIHLQAVPSVTSCHQQHLVCAAPPLHCPPSALRQPLQGCHPLHQRLHCRCRPPRRPPCTCQRRHPAAAAPAAAASRGPAPPAAKRIRRARFSNQLSQCDPSLEAICTMSS